MKTSELFGIKFARKYKYKAQVIANFKRWKRENQYFLTLERNKKKLFERIFKGYIKNNPKGYRSYQEIAAELWDELKDKVAATNWQQVFNEVLGKDVEFPNYQVGPCISRRDTKELFRDYNCKHYYLTESAVQECEKLRIAEHDMDWLREAEDGKRQLNWGDQFIRYEKKGDKIIAVAASFTRRQECKYLQHTFFLLDLSTPKLQFDPFAEIIKEQCEKDLHDYPTAFQKKMTMLLCNMIVFLDLMPLKQITLPKWGVLGKVSSSSNQANSIDPVYNNENVQITVVTVNANWNCTVLVGDKWVIRHKRNYLCGKGRTKVRTKYVERHFRRGYVRLAGKLKSASNNYVSHQNKVVQPQQQVVTAAADVDVARKRFAFTEQCQQKSGDRDRRSGDYKRQRTTGCGNGQPEQQDSMDLFQAKLEALKKKYNG